MGNEPPKQPMSIEQAGNYLKEKQETMAEDIRKEAKENPISFATHRDRTAYLLYGLSLMSDITESTKNRFCEIAGLNVGLHTRREVCKMMRQILALRVNGYSIERISHHLKTEPDVLTKCEKFIVRTVMETIERMQNKPGAIPILGG